MESTPLQKRLINKVKTLSADQLTWLEKVLSNAPFAENEFEENLMTEIMLLQDNGGSFDFLNDEPEIYSAKDYKFLYDPKQIFQIQ